MLGSHPRPGGLPEGPRPQRRARHSENLLTSADLRCPSLPLSLHPGTPLCPHLGSLPAWSAPPQGPTTPAGPGPQAQSSPHTQSWWLSKRSLTVSAEESEAQRLTSAPQVKAGPPLACLLVARACKGVPAVPCLPAQLASLLRFLFSLACQGPQGPPAPRAPLAPSSLLRYC